jgi:short-subunit dehydrogenase
MSKTIAIFGAGTGLGISTARRFGREGYQVALIGRRPHPLGTLISQLTEQGINAAAFPADLAQTSSVPSSSQRSAFDLAESTWWPILRFPPIRSSPPLN